MNTNTLKKFAQDARRKLLEQVSSKLDYVLSHDSSTLRAKTETLKRLNDELKSVGRDALVDKVAYTWFNRLVALRFMDANGFQPMGIKVITPVSGISPQILEEAHAGHIPDELPLLREEVMDILDGRVPSVNPDNDAYQILLVASCNQLSSTFPFLFERIKDYTELLLPDDLTSPFSIIKDILNGMSDEDCQEVEIIGWLYQFYISERKDEVFASKEKVKKEDIPAATQLFTPRWIVEYMVQNTLGKLWLQNRPNSKLRDFMPYYIESPSVSPSGEMFEGQRGDFLKVNSVEEITLLDQACGSGHILVYGFELFSKIYEEEGYPSSEIPQFIIEKNLFGFEIDERAAQLAGFALMMKARSYHRRFFRKEVKPNILCFQDLRMAEDEIKPLFKDLGISISDELFYDLKTMKQATNFGSLIQPHTNTDSLEETRTSLQSKLQESDIFLIPKLEDLIKALDQLIPLSKKYHCVTDNPPYMGGGKMNNELLNYVKTNFPDAKADVLTCFIERGYNQVYPNGFMGFVTMESWMFLSSFEDFRKKLIENHRIHSLSHFGWHIMRIAFGTVSFVLENNTPSDDFAGTYSYMEYDNIDKESERPIDFPLKDNGRFKIANQNDFEKIPGSPIGYWVPQQLLNVFSSKKLEDVSSPRLGMATADNLRYLRFTWEEGNKNIGLAITSREDAVVSEKKWFLYAKGGDFRKWYGNIEYLVNWENDGEEIRGFTDDNGKVRSHNYNLDFIFKDGITWNALSSGNTSFRVLNHALFDNAGSSLFPLKDISYLKVLGYLNSKVVRYVLPVINPTLNYQPGTISKLPFIDSMFLDEEKIEEAIKISKQEWSTRETSLEFTKNPILDYNSGSVEESYDLFTLFWTNKSERLKLIEYEIDSSIIKAYGLESEIENNPSFEEISILRSETRIDKEKLIFLKDEIFSQFVSYAVGCMFGRYSLEKEGLILANLGEMIEDYFNKIGKPKEEVDFHPDEDNIIPILDDEWFEDDIVSRFHDFLKASFGEKNFRKNLAFVEECLGKDIRKYFVKDFYKDHIQRYKKRPIYWSFSSPKGYFNVLIYMHRYTPDTLNRILNNYLREFIEKLQAHRKNLLHIEVSGTPAEQNKARKEINKLDEMIADCRQYETDILYPLATERISIDLDDGVLVNYNKFGKAITEVKGLNDKKTKDKVRKFDWIDSSQIR